LIVNRHKALDKLLPAVQQHKRVCLGEKTRKEFRV
jgi:hypothetical protein